MLGVTGVCEEERYTTADGRQDLFLDEDLMIGKPRFTGKLFAVTLR